MKIQHGITRHIRENNIRMDLREIGGLESSSSGYGPVAGFFEHGNEHFGSVKSGSFFTS
jgi:hypothetical protein